MLGANAKLPGVRVRELIERTPDLLVGICRSLWRFGSWPTRWSGTAGRGCTPAAGGRPETRFLK